MSVWLSVSCKVTAVTVTHFDSTTTLYHCPLPCRQPLSKQVAFVDDDSSRSSSLQHSPSPSPDQNDRWRRGRSIVCHAGATCLQSLKFLCAARHSTKKRRTPGGKFNALFRRHTTGKGGGTSNGSGMAHKSYMRSAGGDSLYSGSKGGCPLTPCHV